MDKFCGSRFWDEDIFWNTDDPDLTLCFEKTVLVCLPCTFLWIILPFEIYFIFYSKTSDIPLNGYNVSKLTGIVILAAHSLSDIVRNVLLADSFFPVDFYSPLINFCTFVLFFILTYANVKFGRISSPLLFSFSLLLVVFGAPRCRTEVLSKWSNGEKFKTMASVWYIIYYLITLVIFLMNCFADSTPQTSSRPVDKNSCPKNQSSFLSQLLFSWFDPLAWKGYKKSLMNDDLWDLDYSMSSASIVPKFEKYWKKSLEKAEKARNLEIKTKYKKGLNNVDAVEHEFNKNRFKSASIVPALCRTFGITFLLGTALKIFLDVFSFANPLILSLLIDYMASNEPKWKGCFYAILLLLVAVIQTLGWSQYQQLMYTIGFQIRTCLISIIYKKALSISNGARRNYTVGETTNLMSVDADAFVEIMATSYLLFSTPLLVVLSIYFLWKIIGPSVLVGVAVLVISIFANTYVASRIKLLQFKQMYKKDNRVKLMNQILSGFKVLKLYAWEPSFEKQALEIRNEEMKISKRQAFLYGIVTFILSFSTFLVYFATYGAFVLTSEKNVLDPNITFVSLALFNILRLPLKLVPKMMNNVVQAGISVRRINEFLNSEDLSSNNITHENRSEALIIENGSFSWDEAKGQPILRNINVKINPGSLIAVVGPVGSGKSSLICAFLGEMHKLSGDVNTKGTIGYVPQLAWIQNASLRDNITLGKPPRNVWYNKVLEACALKPDLEILPGGDLTEIGEMGINLSGGQKQRVSLARAVYYEADVYFLDDPLSAVDSYVGKHIFDQVIGPKGLLKEKTRVLVTHSVTYLSQVDFIVVMKNGSISESGSFNELLNNDGEFSDFLVTYLEGNSDSDNDGLKICKEIFVERAKSSKKFIRRDSNRSKSGSIRSSKRRRTSVNSRNRGSFQEPENVENPIMGEKLTEDERIETGAINWNVYKHFAQCAGIFVVFVVIFSSCLVQALSVISNMWLSKWSDDATATTPEGTQNIGKRNYYLSIYAVLGFGKAVAEFFTDIAIRIGCWKSATILHNLMLYNIFRLPLSFMDVTPVGRILSRFSKDTDVLDTSLPQQIGNVFFSLGEVICTLIIVSCSTPVFISVMIPLGALFYIIQRFYVATSRQLKRLQSVSRSPIYSHFIETIVGAPSIRAYGLSEKFIKQSEEKVDLNHKSYYLSIVSSGWLSIRSEAICDLVIFFAALFAVLDRENLSPGVAGLSISYTLQISLALNRLVFMFSEIETNVVSVERIKEYSEIPQEAKWRFPNEFVPENWPSKGEISFQDFKVRYRKGLQLVLKGITFSVDGGQKIGIVGRTGAGKSSLTLSLFRIIESAGGKILIDGIDIGTLGLHTVRSKLTIIPQDPVLFAGSLRMNLDPFDEYSDNNLWQALELAHLKQYVLNLDGGLHYEITEGGENFSVGQRQLICLTRALLRKTKILILDEATAAVDLETDDLIQTTIRNEFKNCTVLTIAHRLNTIMDYDKIMVFDEGYLMEWDSPQVLLRLKNSLFYGMVANAGLV